MIQQVENGVTEWTTIAAVLQIVGAVLFCVVNLFFWNEAVYREAFRETLFKDGDLFTFLG